MELLLLLHGLQANGAYTWFWSEVQMKWTWWCFEEEEEKENKASCLCCSRIHNIERRIGSRIRCSGHTSTLLMMCTIASKPLQVQLPGSHQIPARFGWSHLPSAQPFCTKNLLSAFAICILPRLCDCSIGIKQLFWFTWWYEMILYNMTCVLFTNFTMTSFQILQYEVVIVCATVVSVGHSHSLGSLWPLLHL